LSYKEDAKREKLISAIRKWCRKNGTVFALDREGGKGSHYKVTVEARWTIIQSGEILPRHVDTILAQLGIPKDEIRR
jgi:hypothetical protein